MAENENQNQNPPAETETAPPAGGGASTPPAGTSGQSTTDDLDKLSADELKALAKKERADRQEANKEAQTLRAKNKELTDAEEKRKLAEMSELEKAQKAAKDADERVAAANQRIVDAEIKLAASAAGFKNPDFAVRLIDRSKLVNGEDGMPTNLQQLCEDLIKENPELKGAAVNGLPSSQSTRPDATSTVTQARTQEIENRHKSVLSRLQPR